MTDTSALDPAQYPLPVRALFEEGRALSRESRRKIIALGERATPDLIEVMRCEPLWDDQAPGEGFAPIHAAEILGEIGDTRALKPLYDTLREVDPDAILDDAITGAIRAYGEAAIVPGRRQLDSWDDPFLADLAHVFSGLDVRHDKALQVLLKYFITAPVPAADLLADYGDPVAIDALEVALERYLVAASGDPKYRRPILGLARAIERLGGKLPGYQREIVDSLVAMRPRSEEVREALKNKAAPDDDATFKKARDVGRNDPCWCGSGKKYKRCHRAEDLA